MAMRLLTQPEGKSRRETENASQQVRSQELDTLILAKRKEINDLDAVLVRALSEQGAKNYEEERKWKEKIANLTREVEVLESRKKSALVPLETREKEADNRERVLLEREEKTTLKESDLEYTRQLLEDKLDSVSEREQSAIDYSNTLTNREYVIQVKEKEVETRTQALTATLKESLESIELSKNDLANQKAVLKGREVSLIERERIVAQKEAGFVNREKKILDQYKTRASSVPRSRCTS